MPEIFCTGGVDENGTKMCTRHGKALIPKAEAEARGLTQGKLDLGAEWFCPETGSAFGGFDTVEKLHDDMSDASS